MQVAIGFGFDFHWLKKWRQFCWSITERSQQNQSKRNLHSTFFETRSNLINSDCSYLIKLDDCDGGCLAKPKTEIKVDKITFFALFI